MAFSIVVGWALAAGPLADAQTQVRGVQAELDPDAVGRCDGATLETGADPPRDWRAGAPQILFLEFDSVSLTQAYDDAPNNLTGLSGMGGSWTSVGWAESRIEEVTGMVADHFAPYNVIVTRERPAEGPYTMIVIGRNGSFTNGVATLDCGNTNANNVGFVNPEPSYGTDTDAALIAHEAGHTFGLDHEQFGNTYYIMNPTVYAGARFSTSCQGLSDNGCTATHEKYCGAGSQDSNAEMLGQIGAVGEGDTTPPTISIVSPADGAIVGNNFTVAVQVADDQGIDRVEYRVDGEVAHTAAEPPYEWSAQNAPPATYTIEATVFDTSIFSASDQITITVDDDAPDTTGDGSGSESGGSDGGTGSTDSSGSGTGVDPTDGTGLGDSGGADDESTGCSVLTRPHPGTTSALALFVLASLRRRSR